MLHLAVVEDDPLYAKQLQEYLDQYAKDSGRKFDVRFFSDGEDIIDNYRAGFHIILMDIQMQFLDGLTTAKLIREKDEKVIIIFITNMASYAIRGYEVDALDFIIKPVSYPILVQKLQRAMKRLDRDEEHFILIATGDGTMKMPASQIYYIESQRHQMIYHTTAGVLEAGGRLDDLEKELAPYQFFRSNKGYLVNMRYVEGVQNDCCLIAGDRLIISRRRKAAFMEQFSKAL